MNKNLHFDSYFLNIFAFAFEMQKIGACVPGTIQLPILIFLGENFVIQKLRITFATPIGNGPVAQLNRVPHYG